MKNYFILLMKWAFVMWYVLLTMVCFLSLSLLPLLWHGHISFFLIHLHATGDSFHEIHATVKVRQFSSSFHLMKLCFVLSFFFFSLFWINQDFLWKNFIFLTNFLYIDLWYSIIDSRHISGCLNIVFWTFYEKWKGIKIF